MATMSYRSPDIACSNCSTPWKIAKVRCLNCKEYLCDDCYTSHSTLKAMEGHNIISMADIKAGKVNLENEEKKRFCNSHGNVYEYYCEIDKRPVCKDCIILNACSSWHRRTNLKTASQSQRDQLKYLATKNMATLIHIYNDAVLATNSTKHDLGISSKKQYEILENAEKECIRKVKQVFQGFQSDLACTKKKITAELAVIDDDLQSSITGIKECIRKAENLVQTNSEFEIVSAHQTLSRQLEKLSTGQPKGASKNTIEFDVALPAIKEHLEKLLKKRLRLQKWQLISKFNTGNFDKLSGLCLDYNDHIALCSLKKGLKIFSRNGAEICTLYNSPGANGVSANSDNDYFSISRSKKTIKINDASGDDINSIIITDVNDKRSNANSITLDSDNRIIVGQVNNTISIHNNDGSVICKFATKSTPSRLAATSNGLIVCSFYDAVLKRGTTVELMDYCGGIVRVLQPPDEVKLWCPLSVCCVQGEIFVTNSYVGDPTGVYRYTSEGDYLSCVTTEISNPAGIALSEDGTELFVADFKDGSVKIFQKP